MGAIRYSRTFGLRLEQPFISMKKLLPNALTEQRRAVAVAVGGRAPRGRRRRSWIVRPRSPL